MPGGMVWQLVKFVGEGPCAHTGTRPHTLAPDDVAFSDERLIFKFFIFPLRCTGGTWCGSWSASGGVWPCICAGTRRRCFL